MVQFSMLELMFILVAIVAIFTGIAMFSGIAPEVNTYFQSFFGTISDVNITTTNTNHIIAKQSAFALACATNCVSQGEELECVAEVNKKAEEFQNMPEVAKKTEGATVECISMGEKYKLDNDWYLANEKVSLAMIRCMIKAKTREKEARCATLDLSEIPYSWEIDEANIIKHLTENKKKYSNWGSGWDSYIDDLLGVGITNLQSFEFEISDDSKKNFISSKYNDKLCVDMVEGTTIWYVQINDCSDYRPGIGKCNVNNFWLPEEFESIGGTESLAGDVWEELKLYVRALGNPTFIVYYQDFPAGQDAAWKSFESWWERIASAAIWAVPLGSAVRLGGRAITGGAKMISGTVLKTAAQKAGQKALKETTIFLVEKGAQKGWKSWLKRVFFKDKLNKIVVKEYTEKAAKSPGKTAFDMFWDDMDPVLRTDVTEGMLKKLDPEFFGDLIHIGDPTLGAQEMKRLFKESVESAFDPKLIDRILNPANVRRDVPVDLSALLKPEAKLAMERKFLVEVSETFVRKAVAFYGFTGIAAYATTIAQCEQVKTETVPSSMVLLKNFLCWPGEQDIYEIEDTGIGYDIGLPVAKPVILYKGGTSLFGLIGDEESPFYLASPCHADLVVEDTPLKCNTYYHDRDTGRTVCLEPQVVEEIDKDRICGAFFHDSWLKDIFKRKDMFKDEDGDGDFDLFHDPTTGRVWKFDLKNRGEPICCQLGERYNVSSGKSVKEKQYYWADKASCFLESGVEASAYYCGSIPPGDIWGIEITKVEHGTSDQTSDYGKYYKDSVTLDSDNPPFYIPCLINKKSNITMCRLTEILGMQHDVFEQFTNVLTNQVNILGKPTVHIYINESGKPIGVDIIYGLYKALKMDYGMTKRYLTIMDLNGDGEWDDFTGAIMNTISIEKDLPGVMIDERVFVYGGSSEPFQDDYKIAYSDYNGDGRFDAYYYYDDETPCSVGGIQVSLVDDSMDKHRDKDKYNFCYTKVSKGKQVAHISLFTANIILDTVAGALTGGWGAFAAELTIGVASAYADYYWIGAVRQDWPN